LRGGVNNKKDFSWNEKNDFNESGCDFTLCVKKAITHNPLIYLLVLQSLNLFLQLRLVRFPPTLDLSLLLLLLRLHLPLSLSLQLHHPIIINLSLHRTFQPSLEK
jgi:hypothetical protein